MTIQPMLLRLQSAFEPDTLSNQMLLQPGLESFANAKRDRHSMNLVIGYKGSANSQNALDFGLWMAHQTRLATRKQVTVHVVHVLEQPALAIAPLGCSSPLPKSLTPAGATATLARPILNPSPLNSFTTPDSAHALEQADQILWQARCLADEWRGSLEAHLGFGDIATELRRVVELKHADLLIVGCSSPKHPLVRQLTSKFPCPVLGIPADL